MKNKTLMLTSILASIFLISMVSASLQTATYDFNNNTGVNLFAYDHDSNWYEGCTSLLNSLNVCGSVNDITNENYLKVDDGDMGYTRVEDNSDGEHGWIKLTGKTDINKEKILSLNWTTDVYYWYRTYGYDYGIYLWNYTSSKWVLVDPVDYDIGWGSELTISIATANVQDFVNAQGESNLLLWGWIKDGIHNVGKMQIDYAKLNVQYDTIAPSISITSPTEAFTSNSNLNVIYSASDSGTGLNSCWYNLNGGSDVPVTCNEPINAVWTEGLNTLVIHAKDNVNNENSASVSFTLDTINPVVQITSPTEGSTFTYSERVIIHHTASDSGSGLQNCWYTINGGTIKPITCGTDITLPTANPKYSPFQVNYEVKIFAKDLAGNIGFDVKHYKRLRLIPYPYEPTQINDRMTAELVAVPRPF